MSLRSGKISKTAGDFLTFSRHPSVCLSVSLSVCLFTIPASIFLSPCSPSLCLLSFPLRSLFPSVCLCVLSPYEVFLSPCHCPSLTLSHFTLTLYPLSPREREGSLSVSLSLPAPSYLLFHSVCLGLFLSPSGPSLFSVSISLSLSFHFSISPSACLPLPVTWYGEKSRGSCRSLQRPPPRAPSRRQPKPQRPNRRRPNRRPKARRPKNRRQRSRRRSRVCASSLLPLLSHLTVVTT